MKPLTGLDGLFLHLETAETPMHVASLHLLDLPRGDARDFAERVRREVQRRLSLLPVFQRRLAPMPLDFANPVWVTEGDVDLDHHVRQVALPPPGTLTQLEAAVAQWHAQRLDRTRPLWRIVVFTGLQDRRAACYIQVHHAVLDGHAAMLLAGVLFDATPRARRLPLPPAAPHAAAPPGALALAAAAVRRDAALYAQWARRTPELLRALARLAGPAGARSDGALGQNLAVGPKTVLNVPVGPERSIATLSLPISALKQLAGEHGATLNDVVLALCSGALRRYLAHHGGIPRKPLLAAMPVSLREAGSLEYGTQVTLSLVNLQTHVADPLRRLAAIRDAAGAMKRLVHQARSVVPVDFPSIGVPWLVHGAALLYGRSRLADAVVPLANVLISNVPGPKAPLYLAGARLASYWPLSAVEHGIGVNITVISYADSMDFGVVAARVAVPDAHGLTTALRHAFDELAAAGAPPAARHEGARA